MGVTEARKRIDISPSAYLFRKADTAKHAYTRAVSAFLAVPTVLVEFPTRVAVGTTKAVKDSIKKVLPIHLADGEIRPSARVLQEARNSKHLLSKLTLGTAGTIFALSEASGRAAVGTAKAVYNAAERVTRA